MKFEKIDSKARVWVIKRGPDGGLKEQFDPERFASLYPHLSGEELTEAVVIAAGTAEIAESRVW